MSASTTSSMASNEVYDSEKLSRQQIETGIKIIENFSIFNDLNTDVLEINP